jgi:hypothetical protein
MIAYPSFASTASLPSALEDSANHVDAGEDFDAVSRLVGNRVSRAVVFRCRWQKRAYSIVMNRSKIQLAGRNPCHVKETRSTVLTGPSSGTR